MSYYDVLGVDPTSSSEEVKWAYRRQARLLHPDRRADSSAEVVAETTRAMGDLNAAFDALVAAQPKPHDPRSIWHRWAGIWTRRRFHYVGLVLLAVLVFTIWVAKSDSIARAKVQRGASSAAGASATSAPSPPSPSAASGQVASTPTLFPGFVHNLQADLRAGLIPGLAALPAATVDCPEQDLLFPGDVFACNFSGFGSGTAQAVVTVQAPHGQLFTVAIGSVWSCPLLSSAEVLALHRIGAAVTC